MKRRQFHVALASLPLCMQAAQASAEEYQTTSPSTSVGPVVGHVSPTSAMLWMRPSDKPGDYLLRVYAAASPQPEWEQLSSAAADHDYCVKWLISGLQPETEYRYEVTCGGQSVAQGDDLRFKTAPASAASKVRFALGSCASMDPIRLWSDIEQRQVDGLLLLGDTPYIDSTDLAFARQRHREFLSIAPLAKLLRHTPTWSTWDDHDFGGNDTSGKLVGKANTRQAFTEYRANPSFGHDDQGIYCRFSYGPVDVWLLDTRWFSDTEPSPADASKPTLLGKRQWQWLLDSLKQSTAPFKLLTCGMIWDDKENRERDDWGTYAYERQRLFQLIGEHKIPGVILVGGDIHCSRLLKYKTEGTCGYPIYQLIVSPFHSGVIPSLNVAHPDLIHGSATPHVWLQLDIDATQTPATLRAEWVQMDGAKMWTLNVTATELHAEAS